MTNSYFHEARGDYNIAEQRIRLNYKVLAGNPVQTELTLMHEWAHRLLADTDFGQAIYIFYQIIPSITKLSREEIVTLSNCLYDEQKFVQEGFATYIQYGRLLNLKGERDAENWRNNSLNAEYKEYLDKMLFIFDFTQEERDFFSGKISYIVLETGIRRNAVKDKILSDSKKLKEYLENDNNNPNKRLEKVIVAIEKNKELLLKDNETIAKAAGITFNFPTTKEEIAAFLNYVTSLTDSKKIYNAEDITEALAPSKAISDSMDDLVVVNLSLNLAESSTMEFEHNDFLQYADKIEIIFTTYHNKDWEERDFIKQLAKRDPDIGIIAFLADGSKIITYATIEEATRLINNDLKNVTFATHWSWFNSKEDRVTWSDEVRKPDIIVYETIKNIRNVFKDLILSDSSLKFSRLHLAIMEDHPLQTLLVNIKSRKSIHIVNHFANKAISDVISVIKDKSEIMDKSYLISNKKHLNNIFSSWMGLFWEVDWIEGSFNPNIPTFRKF